MSARILKCTSAEYHADPCDVPSLSSSIAHVLTSKSPLHAWLEHPKLGGQSRRPTKEMSTGSLVHSLLLGRHDDLSVVDAENWRTKDAQSRRDQAVSVGKLPVLLGDVEDAKDIVAQISNQLAARGIVLDGDSEVALTWDERASNGDPVQCRGMIDHLKLDAGVIYDLKTIKSADPKVCTRHALDYGYTIQRAAYTSVIGNLRPDLVGRVDFLFIFCEVEPPYCVTIARLDGSMRSIGEHRWQRAVDTWAACQRTGVWPGYSNDIITLEAPTWALTDAMQGAYSSGNSLLEDSP